MYKFIPELYALMRSLQLHAMMLVIIENDTEFDRLVIIAIIVDAIPLLTLSLTIDLCYTKKI